jgi:hypothetical protein
MKSVIRYALALLLPGFALTAGAQTWGSEAYGFLRLPASARAAALGGANISVVEPDPSLALQNPALLGPEMGGFLQVGYLNFYGGVHSGDAIYAQAAGEKAAWAVSARYLSYGSMPATDSEGLQSGDFTANDISLGALYAHSLSEHWRGGLSLQFLYSSIERYSSVGLAVDAGLSYYNSAQDFSAALTLRSIGAQLKAYEEKRYALPWDVQLGISKRLAHAPFRISVTAVNLNKWKVFWSEHLVFGLDFIPSDNVWLGLGYNPQAAREMKLEGGGNGLGGFSVGGGLRIRSFCLDLALARYYPAATSLLLSLSIPVSVK